MEQKRLGNYIRQVDVRNTDLAVNDLQGLKLDKTFFPSIANTIGTDLSKYKIVESPQFAYVPVTSRNGDKITIALYSGKEKAIVSQAYTVFEIEDQSTLLPAYLMLWFKRPEFDRFARFKSHLPTNPLQRRRPGGGCRSRWGADGPSPRPTGSRRSDRIRRRETRAAPCRCRRRT